MDKVYLYQCCDWCADFYVRKKRLSLEECYCAAEDGYDVLIGEFDNEAEFERALTRLFLEDYTLRDLMGDAYDYEALRDRCCPPSLWQWELGQYKKGTEEYGSLAAHLKELEDSFDMRGLEYKEIDGQINPYYYIDSPSERAQLRSQNHQFSDLEVAQLIRKSKDTPVRDRHAAWKKLMETRPDCIMPKPFSTEHQQSLYAFLRQLITAEEEMVENFYRNEEPVEYSFCYHASGDWYENYARKFSDWKACSHAMAEVELADRIHIRKHTPDSSHRDLIMEMDGLRRICRIEAELCI